MKSFLFFLTLSFTVVISLFGQNSSTPALFKNLILKSDTLEFSLTKDTISSKGIKYLYFYYAHPDETCELSLFPDTAAHISKLELLNSSDFAKSDSLVFVNQKYYKLKVKFANLSKSRFLSFMFSAKIQGTEKPVIQEVKLLPYTHTSIGFFPGNEELFIGEEKIFDLTSNNSENIRLTGEWVSGEGINYRISERNGQLRVHLIPNALGQHQVTLRLQTNAPFITNSKEISYNLPPITQSFKIKASRLAFLGIDKKEITYEDDARKNGIEIQLDNHRQLILGKTYRIEEQEQAGGSLIAELFTKSYLTNDRVLCIFRPYSLHRTTAGYLYIKDGDDSRFITNIAITPKTSINSIQVMHEGQDWSPNQNVYPGETVEVKLEGDGFHKAKFHWEDVTDITPDTLMRNETQCYFKLKVPLDINKHRVALFNYGVNTGYGLSVKEYQTPRPLDFVTLNYGTGTRSLSKINPTVIQRNTINDITIGFDNTKIDANNKLYGKQYLDVEIRVLGKSGELIEMKSVKNLVICPENSPRSVYYKDKACTNSDLQLNTLLSNKTYKLSDFSKIQLEFKEQSDKYTEPAFSKQVEINLQRATVFDMDVSFPAGLMIQNLGKTQSEKDAFAQYNIDNTAYQLEYNAYLKELELWTATPSGSKPTFDKTAPVKPTKASFTDNLGGISLALIVQFSFPDPEKVGQSKPYRLGAGFLAINAFNFSQSAQRDLAAVILASLYPIKPGKLFSLPIHLGFGYKFQDKIPFLMLSPGIGVRF
ncbi:MAG: hypothetical protein Q8928_09730 [Bacteroidota bacterium]|nr:hypothetical protein [Bacteroidota bacterium]